MTPTDSRSGEPGGSEQPHEAVTLLLTDIAGSTQLLQSFGDLYAEVVVRSRELIRAAIAQHGGTELDAQGDSFFAAFGRANDGVRAAVGIQRAFDTERWPSGASVRVRIGVHTGQPRLVGTTYFGLDVHRTARIAAAAGGGQIVLSLATRAQIGPDDLSAGIRFRDLGAHRLKDLRHPEVLFDVEIPGLPARFGPLQSLDAQPNNLPVPPTTFIGRERQVQEVRALLLRGDTRLLTLTGPGGTGKTRLALEAGRALLGAFAHGIFVVELASVADPNLFASAAVHALGVPELGSRSPLDSLTHHLAPREMLLVLDNLEQIIEVATDVLALLHHCPRLKILATSREPLNLRLEREYPVSPLQVPEGAERIDPRSLATIEAVRLFVERAQAYDPHFTLTAENASAVSAICVHLDGLPLALELAASWLRLYSPQALLDRLRHSIDLLTGGPRDLARHQQTLKDTIAWSYDLLNSSEQLLFRQLSVCVGGCTADSAVEIISGPQPSAAVVSDLRSLVRKSLLTQATVEGEARLGMLETIRQFGRQQLEATSEGPAVHQKHAEHYLLLAEAMAPALLGRQQRRFVTPLLAEQDNLRAALGWAIERRNPDIASRFLTALLWLWIPQGQFAEGRAWARKALDRFIDLDDAREVALMLEAAGWLEVLAGDYPAALPLFERSYDIFHRLPDVTDRARAKVTLGVTCLVLGDERGAALSDEAVALFRTTGDKGGTALALLSAGIKYQMCGNMGGAAAAYEEALRAFSEADNVFWPGQVLYNLAQLRLQEGDWSRAADLASEALEIAREYDYPMIRNLSLSVLGGVAHAKGMPVLAAQLFGAVDASLADLGVTLEPPDQAAMQMNVDATKAALGTDAFAAAFDEGRQWRDGAIATAAASVAAAPLVKAGDRRA